MEKLPLECHPKVAIVEGKLQNYPINPRLANLTKFNKKNKERGKQNPQKHPREENCVAGGGWVISIFHKVCVNSADRTTDMRGRYPGP